MREKIEVNHYKMGLSSILTIIFVIAKITGYIHWSWWLVFLPTLISLGILLLILLCLAVVAGLVLIYGGR